MSEFFFERKRKELGVDLNDVQKQAVVKKDGPLLLLATPGSGKTTTLIMRIGYLIEEKGVAPNRIMAVTFSTASANDMSERFNAFFPDIQPVRFSTIHSLAFRIVREHFQRESIAYELIEGRGNIAAQGNQRVNKRMLLREIYEDIHREKITDDQLDALLTYITYVKNKMIPLNKLRQVNCDVPLAEDIYRKYEEFKRNHDVLLIDFDDMLTIANGILAQHDQLLKKYQDMFDYILTDESQDTSLVQHKIIEKLVEKHQNICVVGDDDQSVYSWRGAEPKYLIDFKKRYKNAEILKLQQNYRSTQNIVNVADKFIHQNKNRAPKEMFTKNDVGTEIVRKILNDYKEQAPYVVGEVIKEKNLREIAILYRNNTSSVLFVHELERAGIPFYIKDTDNRFFSHWVVQDILNFMRMTFNDRMPGLLETIYSKFNGYITRGQIDNLKRNNDRTSVFDQLAKGEKVKPYQVKTLTRCKKLFADMNAYAPQRVIRVIREDLGYEKTLEGMSERLGFNKDYLFGILNTLEDIARPMKTIEEFAHHLKHLENVMKDAQKNIDANAVTLTTLHSAKGLEFDRVYIVDLIDGIIPSVADEEDESGNLMEEAVRLFYVGMTRARIHLELLTYRSKYGVRTEISTFFKEVNYLAAGEEDEKETPAMKIPPNPNAITDVTDVSVGKKVKHRVFGSGEIIHINDDIIQLKLGEEIKKVAISVCIELGILESIE